MTDENRDRLIRAGIIADDNGDHSSGANAVTFDHGIARVDGYDVGEVQPCIEGGFVLVDPDGRHGPVADTAEGAVRAALAAQSYVWAVELAALARAHQVSAATVDALGRARCGEIPEGEWRRYKPAEPFDGRLCAKCREMDAADQMRSAP